MGATEIARPICSTVLRTPETMPASPCDNAIRINAGSNTPLPNPVGTVEASSRVMGAADNVRHRATRATIA
jgi:hypothetical protein